MLPSTDQLNFFVTTFFIATLYQIITTCMYNVLLSEYLLYSRNLRIKETTLRRYNAQLLNEQYIRKVKAEKGKTYHYEIVNVQEYTDLKAQINKALNNCLTALQSATSPLTRHV